MRGKIGMSEQNCRTEFLVSHLHIHPCMHTRDSDRSEAVGQMQRNTNKHDIELTFHLSTPQPIKSGRQPKTNLCIPTALVGVRQYRIGLEI